MGGIVFKFRHYCSTKNLVVLMGLGVMCLPLWLSLIPHLDQGRQEARTAWAFIQVRRLHNETTGSENEVGSGETSEEGVNVVTELSDLDPWGQHYQLVTRHGKETRTVRVFSFGSDESSASGGLDQDDIASDMKVRPTQQFDNLRRSQWLVAFGVSGAAWFATSWLYFAAARRQSQLDKSSH